MIDLKADLHIHTNCSDGDLTIDEVLKIAKEKNLLYVGIVDHDTIRQFKEIKKSGLASQMRKSGTRIWVGTEFSCKLGNKKMHIIGYNFDEDNEKIVSLIEEAVKLRQEDFFYKIKLVKDANLPLSEQQIEELRKIDNVGKPHIAKCLKENGVEGSIHEIIVKYLSSDKILRLDAAKVIRIVHEAGGKIVIAHPYQIATENHIDDLEAEKIWQQLVKLGADGIECFYSKYGKDKINHLINFAKKNDLLMTLGSDFHGSTKPEIQIGDIYKK